MTKFLVKCSIFADLEVRDFVPSAFQGTKTMWDGFGRYQILQINSHLLWLILDLKLPGLFEAKDFEALQIISGLENMSSKESDF